MVVVWFGIGHWTHVKIVGLMFCQICEASSQKCQRLTNFSLTQVSEFNDFFDEHAIAGSIVKGRECVAVTDSEVLIDEPEVRFVSLDSVELY